ncbi:uncharacterized protein LOC112567339 isoform X1 [Pomacea canaliculata]|uniref:uncharacterized protein LOC112567339 isoform X1 n=1 Tax=Pomacea canaliculata TaxID=400727 RepID=UPI000D730378|nr:uncharacterized protein LOC112567339 isoform X1 [Pomacea canaliculata]
MRHFQTYLLYDTVDCPAPTPPPFMSGRDGWRSTCLVRETTSLLREGQKRVATPERLAVLQLASSWEKRRLGRQQQVLSDIARRCREQEVTDLSSRITGKRQGRDGETQKGDLSSPRGSHRKMAATRPDGHMSDSSPSDENPCNIDIIDKKLEKSYKFFPARKIIRLPGRLRLHQDGSTSTRSLPTMCVTSFQGARFSERGTTRSFPFFPHTSMLNSQTHGYRDQRQSTWTVWTPCSARCLLPSVSVRNLSAVRTT